MRCVECWLVFDPECRVQRESRRCGDCWEREGMAKLAEDQQKYLLGNTNNTDHKRDFS